MAREIEIPSYEASDIQVLEGLEAVRRRPGMYIGSTDIRGLHHLVYEVVDNSIDEALAGICDRIEITIHPDNTVTVADNGRGIPVGINEQTGKSALEVVHTVLHAGAKFGGGSYKVASGLHGVGVSAVNALSAWLEVEVKQNGKKYRQRYEKGIPVTSVEKVGRVKKGESGTTTTFMPDETIIRTLDYRFDTLAQRFREMAFLTQGLTIAFYDERSDREMTFYFEGGVNSLVRYINRNRDVLHHPPFYVQQEVEGTLVEAAIQYHDGYAQSVYAFANNVNTTDGGTHMTGFRSAITRSANDYAHKNGVLKDSDPNFSGDDVREGMTGVISVKMSDPQFESQTKSKLGNAEVRGQVESVVSDAFSRFLEENSRVANQIMKKALTASRARRAARKARDLVIRKSVLESMTLPGKLADCASRNASNAELYLVEGDSAGGSAKQGRDRRFQAILPLRGKILNVEKRRLNSILNNKEIQAMITAIGAGIGPTFDISNLRYDRVIIMTDADVDGAHIATLLLTFFFRYMEPLVEKGHLFLAKPPLYRLSNGRTVEYAFTEEERIQLMKEISGNGKVALQRYKGLGEMNPTQLWETTMNPETRTIIQVSIEDAAEADRVFDMLMGSSVPPRRRFIQTHARDVTNLDI
jgi:DNA gyrase subunit B